MEKYPPNIQKLFAPKPPLLHRPGSDVPPEERRTRDITPISKLRAQYMEYLEQLPEIEKQQPKTPETKQQIEHKKSLLRKQRQKESFQRQLQEWNDPELLKKHEQEFMKDPFRTVFIARLDYSIAELDISKNFGKYGIIESIRLIRNREGKSMGYGFVVFESENDAKSCVNELAATGLKIPLANGKPARTILVDIERGRLVRNWKPRRLAGGLGGRGYTKPDPRISKNASAAASGRRIHVSNNTHSSYNSAPHSKAPYNSSFSSYDSSYPPSYGPAYSSSYNSYNSHQSKPDPRKEREAKSVRDKYAKYSTSSREQPRPYMPPSSSATDKSRSIRSIRQRD